MSRIHVLLSGGIGSRLWPLSRKSRPKQYIPMFDGKTLFQLTAERNVKLCHRGIVVVNQENLENASENLLESKLEQQYTALVEATPRNTAAAIAFAAFSCDPDDLLFITPSDHLIENDLEYQRAVERAFELAENSFIVTLGICPTRPETGYGYIESSGEDVIRFCEKPNLETAQQFLKHEGFLWNSGIFCFKASVFLQELKLFRPEIYAASLIAWEHRVGNRLPEIESINIPAESVDYAVLENTKSVKVVLSHFKWSDLGSFEALFDYFEEIKNTTFIQSNNLIMTDNLNVEVIGLSEIVVVQSGASLLILPKSEAQHVKIVYEKLVATKSQLI
jgi:mannose-1-phosphate guanylyltransferase